MGFYYNEVCKLDILEKAFRKAEKKDRRPGPNGLSCPIIRPYLPSFLRSLQKELVSNTYLPEPTTQVQIKRFQANKEKFLNVEIMNVKERIVEYAVRLVLELLYSGNSSNISFTHCFRNIMKSEKALKRNVLEAIDRNGITWIASVDVKDYYASINTGLLMSDILRHTQDNELVALIKKCLFLGKKNVGLPIGHILSTFLANYYLLPIDSAIIAMNKCASYRYADNWFLVANEIEEIFELSEYLTQLSRQRGLQLHHLKLLYNPNIEEILSFAL